MRSNALEKGVQAFWEASRAWKRDPKYVGHLTFESFLARIEPLRKSSSERLSAAADDLARLAVSWRVRRKGRSKGKVYYVDFHNKQLTQINGQKVKQKRAA